MTSWLLETGLAVTVLMLVVLAARRPVAHVFGAGWAYALWLLPLLRLVFPQLDLFDLPSIFPQAAVSIPADLGQAAPPPSMDGPGEWVPSLLAIWAGGAAIFFLWQQATYGAFLLSLGRKAYEAVPDFGGIPVIESRAVDGPVAVGIIRRRIVVPADFALRYTPAERRLALEHELVHHRRGDLIWNFAAVLMLGLHWFNPIAWFAFRAFRTDQELSCDAAVAARASAGDRHDYARALVKSASRPGLIATCPLNHAGQLKQRLRMMKAHRRSPLRAAGGSVAVAALLLAGLGITAVPGAAAPEAIAAPEAAIAVTSPVAVQSPPAPAPRPVALAATKSTPPSASRPAAVIKRRAPAREEGAPPAAPVPASAMASAPAAFHLVVVKPVGSGQHQAAPFFRTEPVPMATIESAGPGRIRLIRTHFQAAREANPKLRQELMAMLRQLHAEGRIKEVPEIVEAPQRETSDEI